MHWFCGWLGSALLILVIVENRAAAGNQLEIE